MAVWNQIGTSRLVGAIRLDAEFWQPKYVENEDSIHRGPHASLGSRLATFKKGIFYILAREYAPSGIPFYRSSNVGAILPNDGNLAFITPQKHVAERKTALVRGDLMVVKTGKSGASVVLRETCNVSQDVIATKVRPGSINPFYLAVYLNTRYGSSEMNRWFQGQVQPHLSLDDARRIWLALISQQEQEAIEKKVLAAEKAHNDAATSWATANHILELELGLDKLTFKKPVGYAAQFSDIEWSRRSDAEFYNPELRFLQHKLAEHIGLTPLPTYASVLKFENPTYGHDGLPIVTQKHLRTISPADYQGDLTTTRIWVRSNPSAVLMTNDLLFYSVGAYLGKTNIWFAADKAVFASFITLIRCRNSVDAGFLHVLLNSRYGIIQSKCYQSGTSQQYIYPKDIRRFLIPNVPETIRKRIHELVTQSYSAERESKGLLAQAKARVEQLIEGARANGDNCAWAISARGGHPH